VRPLNVNINVEDITSDGKVFLAMILCAPSPKWHEMSFSYMTYIPSTILVSGTSDKLKGGSKPISSLDSMSFRVSFVMFAMITFCSFNIAGTSSSLALH